MRTNHSLQHLLACGLLKLLKLLKPLSVLTLLTAGWAQAGQVSVAVAANFSAPMQQIAAAFARQTGHRALLSFGSTGKLYAQIHNGAPFQVLLAADEQTPARLEREGRAVAGTRFTYAVGKLVLWSKQPALVDQQGAVLRRMDFAHIALADPKLAPYGAAAIQVLTHLRLQDRLRPRWVYGENIAQAYQFVDSQNAALGFVALSQVWQDGQLRQGSMWLVPQSLYTPLRQDAVLLEPGRQHSAALALLAFMRSAQVREILQGFGYGF